MRVTGQYEVLGVHNHFIPFPLPPQDPPLDLDQETIELYGQAMHRLGQLNEMARRVPNVKRFIKAYVTKEALLSSQIEGIHTTLMDVYSQPILETRPSKETQLVVNYSKALDRALELVREQGIPIVSRVILAAHEALLSQGEGDRASPGEYRKQSVRVGNLIPPPAAKVHDLIADLERFMNADDSFPPIIKAGLAHVQFETIHPFLDGNGRIGRLLIVLMLVNDGLLTQPILYPSYYFKKHHMEYYERLDAVRLRGDFEGWNKYYLKAILESAEDAWKRAKDIEALESTLQHTLLESGLFTKSYQEGLDSLSLLFQFPVIGVKDVAHHLKKSFNGAAYLIEKFEKLEILRRHTEQKRNRLFVFRDYLNLLEKDYGNSQ